MTKFDVEDIMVGVFWSCVSLSRLAGRVKYVEYNLSFKALATS